MLKNGKFTDFSALKRKFAALSFIFILTGGIFAADVKGKNSTAPAKQTAQSKVANPRVQFVQGLQKSLASGDLEKAIASFDELDENLKADTGLMLIKSSLLISANRLDEASKVLIDLEAKDPSNIDVLEQKIMVAKAQGKKGETAKSNAISKVLAIDPNNAMANVELGQEQVLGHRYKGAKNYFLKALKGNPKDFNALFGLGQTSYYLNEIDDARSAFEKILALNPNEAIAYQYLAKLDAEKENYKTAIENVKKAIAIEDNNYEYYMDLGTYSRFVGKFKDAEMAWTKAIELNPDYFLAYAYRAGLYDEQNRFAEALKDYRMVIETNPKYYFAYEALGILAWHEGNWEEARAAFEKAYGYNKENISYPLMIATCYQKQGKAQMAKMFLEKVMKETGDKQTLKFQMIRLYHDMGPGNAETDIALKIQKEDNSQTRGKMLYYFGLYYELKGKDQLAVKYYSEVTNMQSPMFFEFRLAEWRVKNE